MLDNFSDFLIVAIPMFCFGYPFIMSWYWMAGGALYLFYPRDFRRRPGWSTAGRDVATDQHPCAMLQ